MSDGKIEFKARKLLKKFKRLPKEIREGIRKGLKRGLIILEGQVAVRTRIKSRRGSAGLMGRLTSYVVTTGGEIDAAIGFRKTRGFPYEMSQEFGARAKPGKAMAIPLDGTAKALGERGGSAGSDPREMNIVIANGKAFLFPEDSDDGPAYILVKRIPARLNFTDTVTRGIAMLSGEVVKGARAATGAA